MVKMKAERLEKFSKEEIIKFYLRKDYDLEFYIEIMKEIDDKSIDLDGL